MKIWLRCLLTEQYENGDLPIRVASTEGMGTRQSDYFLIIETVGMLNSMARQTVD
jgi:hypothetical protein